MSPSTSFLAALDAALCADPALRATRARAAITTLAAPGQSDTRNYITHSSLVDNCATLAANIAAHVATTGREPNLTSCDTLAVAINSSLLALLTDGAPLSESHET